MPVNHHDPFVLAADEVLIWYGDDCAVFGSVEALIKAVRRYHPRAKQLHLVRDNGAVLLYSADRRVLYGEEIYVRKVRR